MTSNAQHKLSLEAEGARHLKSIEAAQRLERTKWKLDKVIQEMAELQKILLDYHAYVYDMRHRPRDLVLEATM